MKVLKIKDVKSPSRGTSRSAGIDFYTPNDMTPILLGPGEDALIPSGIKAQVPTGYALIAFNKSGIASKNKLTKGAEVVDEDYQGEIHIHIFNSGKTTVLINPGQKLIQFILIKMNYEDVEVVDTLDNIQTERGSGAFGSTGIN
jgi:dUTP pyrophosphatase